MSQEDYIEILSIDLGYDRNRRNAAITLIVGRPIRYLDELHPVEKSKVIDAFKAKKSPEKE